MNNVYFVIILSVSNLEGEFLPFRAAILLTLPPIQRDTLFYGTLAIAHVLFRVSDAFGICLGILRTCGSRLQEQPAC